MLSTTVGYQKRAQWDLSAGVVLLGEVVFAFVVDDDEKMEEEEEEEEDEEDEEDSLTAFSRAEEL